MESKLRFSPNPKLKLMEQVREVLHNTITMPIAPNIMPHGQKRISNIEQGISNYEERYFD